MKLWLLERLGRVGYDENVGHVIAADTEEEARQLANAEAKDEGGIWKSDAAVSCVEIGETDRSWPHIVLRSFNAG